MRHCLTTVFSKTAKLIKMYVKNLKNQVADLTNINVQDVINNYLQIIAQYTSCHYESKRLLDLQN